MNAAIFFPRLKMPNPLKDLVLWRDGEGKWRCFADRCPHRLVPLSEGRVESDGTLLCAYHAWRFDCEGKCVKIPQSQDREIEAKHCANPQSSAMVYPTDECQGLLWVWPEDGIQGQQESKLKKPRLVQELVDVDNSDKVVKFAWYMRDLPYGWDFFMENVCDPAHVSVSHHGIMGSRYDEDKYYDMIGLREMSAQEGFSFATFSKVSEAIHDFQPPCYMKIAITTVDEGKLILALYASPIRPGWCRHIGCQVLVKNKAGKIPKGLAFFALPMPIWLNHVLASLFLHQDLVFLHYQEKHLAKQGKGKWLEKVYTPNPQDKMVIALRKWLELKAGGEIGWVSGCNLDMPPAERDKQQLFDVWTTHTQHCQVCQKALNRINRLALLSYVAAGVFLVLALLLDARAIALMAVADKIPMSDSILAITPTASFWWASAIAIFLAVVGYLLQKLSRLFYLYEFEHAHND